MVRSTSSLEEVRYDHLASAPTSRAGSPPREPVFDEEHGAPEDPSWAWAWRQQEERPNNSPGTVLTGRGTERMSAGSPSSSKRQSPSELGAGKSTHRRQPTTGKGMQARESRARRSTWTCIYCTGVKTILHSDKRGVIQKFKLGVPIRDMRLLDPNLLTSETGKILVRDNAIVFSIEHVRLIITADAVIVPREGFDHNPLNMRFNALLEDMIAEFVQEQARIAMAAQAAQAQEGSVIKQETDAYRSDDESSEYHHEVAPLPFELQVLEVAIKDVCQLSGQLTKELEAVAHPALDALTKQVTTGNLERVRKVKTRHQRLFARVQTIREELQRFLEDDDDMMKMCLTRKKELEATGVQRGYGDVREVVGSLAGRRHSLSIPINTPRHTLHEHRTPFTQGSSPPWTQGMDRTESGAVIQQGGSPEEESDSIEAVENLLESYFMQIDSTHDRLDALGEFIEDTEEYINFSLDSSRNRLLRLEIVLTAGTFGITIFSLVAGILGENLIIPEAITNNVSQFFLVNLVTLIICLLFFVGLMGYIRFRRLM